MQADNKCAVLFKTPLFTMQALKNCEIYFNNPNNVFRPGEYLSGQVKIDFNSDKIIQGVFLVITGRSRVYCPKYPINYKNRIIKKLFAIPYTSSHINKEKFIKEKICIVGRTDTKVKLQKGQHIYNFKYLLPQNLPPSFEGVAGKISYSVRVILKRPWKINKYIEKDFTVENLRTIYEHPKAQIRNKIRIKQQFGDVCKTKSIVTVTIPYSGFAKGQMIPLTLKVENNSNTIINNISITLKEITTFRAHNHRKRDKKILCKSIIEPNISPKTSTIFKHNLKVPNNVTLYDLTNCTIIYCNYYIKVEISALGFNEKLIGWMFMYPLKKAPQFENESQTLSSSL